ncbi:MAG: ATP-binding protein, partial [Oligoflexia bacterium]|nr:ATP-binding protein [Oligoflexia bacterium]
MIQIAGNGFFNKFEIKMKVTLYNTWESADQLRIFLKELGTKYNIPKNILSEIDLALGELLVNIIKYTDKEKGRLSISLDCNIGDNQITFLMKDKGTAFNPLGYQSENQSANIKDKPLGGLGIMIAKNSMDSIS